MWGNERISSHWSCWAFSSNRAGGGYAYAHSAFQLTDRASTAMAVDLEQGIQIVEVCDSTSLQTDLIMGFHIPCQCSEGRWMQRQKNEKKLIVRSNREYKYDYFPSYSSTSTQKVLVLEYDYSISVTCHPKIIINDWNRSKCVTKKRAFLVESLLPQWTPPGGATILLPLNRGVRPQFVLIPSSVEDMST